MTSVNKRRRIRLKPVLYWRLLDAVNAQVGDLPAFEVGGYRVGYGKINGRAYVSSRTKYLGELDPTGFFTPSSDATREEIAIIRSIVENPANAARRTAEIYGEVGRTPVCACCGRELKAPKDRQRGIGAVCWRKWGFNKRVQIPS